MIYCGTDPKGGARPQADQALVNHARCAVDGPSGFDPSRKTWTLDDAVAMCCAVEQVCPPFGCHVALTGGTLYKDGERKDLDLLFYRIRQAPEIDMDGLWGALAKVGIDKLRGFGWCYKAEFRGRKIDCFFPEEASGDYDDGNIGELGELIDSAASGMEAATAGETSTQIEGSTEGDSPPAESGDAPPPPGGLNA